MGWYIEGTDFHFDIRVDKDGLSVSAQSNQVFRSSVDPLEVKIDMTEIKTLPASWSIYRASQAAELANTLSLVVHHDRIDAANPRQIGFSAFLPDQYFENVWELVKFFATATSLRYWMNFDFIGFIPHRVPEHPEVLSYDDWLAGRPCLSEGFAFGLATRTND